ncbi:MULTISPECIES: CHAT domain-containing protein [Acidobacteriaceae]|uniref:CHAT domain-containing protein n=1 Tax=Acidobacteriaceae TaxID=204434 RepID=UPI00131DCD70|nr:MULTISPECIES: CHAT domain-containing protein [Acidobacteriaceae]MDW5266694.1 CHAT domain-containing protein [Edaphobacter sp.]
MAKTKKITRPMLQKAIQRIGGSMERAAIPKPEVIKRASRRKEPRWRLDDVYTAGTILYVVVLDKEHAGEFTFFQGFSDNALSAAGTLRHICELPAHSEELFQERADTARARMGGRSGYAILLLDEEFLAEFPALPGFVCVISNKDNRERVAAAIGARNDPHWRHVTTMEAPTTESKLWELDRGYFHDWAKEVVKGHMAQTQQADLQDGDFKPVVLRETSVLSLASRGHNIVTPTESVFLSLGYSFDLPDDRLAGHEDEAFASALVTQANALETQLSELTESSERPQGVPSVIVTVPSVFRHLKPKIAEKMTEKELRRVLKAVLRQAQYIAYRATPEELKLIMESPVAQSVMAMRAKELYLYTAALTVSACSLCCPVLRLPPQVDRVRDLLLGLAILSRKGNATQRRRNQIAIRIGDSLRSSIPTVLLTKLDTYADRGVKLIGDVPLELLSIGGLPLSLRCSVSRLPTLPGNLMMRHSLMRKPSFLHPKDFHDVLVVRSFAPDDPIRNLLEVSIKVCLPAGSKVRVKFVDVSTEEEFAQAFNNFDGKIAIFDGHGTQSPEDAQGVLSVGSVKINPFQFYGKVRLPAIVLLSACETHSLGGIESSVASALLFMGAWSVLGTLAPVDARASAMLIARFLFRLEAFLPALPGAMNWTEVVTGMLRMSYATDLLFKFEELHGMRPGSLRDVQMTANMAITMNDPAWFEKLLEGIAKKTNEPLAKVTERWRDTCYFTETLRHVHLGSPEHIFVGPE